MTAEAYAAELDDKENKKNELSGVIVEEKKKWTD